MERTRPDACPGALQVHQAADGALARVRLPGGMLAPEQLGVLAKAATELSTGEMELTSRGNIQLRGVTDTAELADRLAEAGLLPSLSHERVRNIVASPLAGRVGGRAIAHVVTELDAALQSNPDLAELPGRILFTVDDGRGDVSGLGADIGVHATADDQFALVLAGADTGVRVPAGDAVSVMVDAARGFHRERDRHWRISELPGGAGSVLAHIGLTPGSEHVAFDHIGDAPVGWFDQDDGRVALGAALAHGILPARTAEFVAAIDRPIIVTPWRSIVIVDLDEGAAEQVVRVLAPMGLIFDAESPWVRLSSCVGSPGCAKSHTDVRGDLDAAVAAGDTGFGDKQHWVGCERRCGRPRGDVTDVVAGADGYTVIPPN